MKKLFSIDLRQVLSYERSLSNDANFVSYGIMYLVETLSLHNPISCGRGGVGIFNVEVLDQNYFCLLGSNKLFIYMK